MTRGIIFHVPHYHHFEEVLSCPQDLVTSCPQKSDLLHLRPRLQPAEPSGLLEITKEVHQPELHHQSIDLMAARVLGLADVGVEVP